MSGSLIAMVTLGSLWALFTGRDARLRGTRLLVVGLGNPGERYARTRHNVGFRAAESVVARLQGVRSFRGCHALLAVGGLAQNGRIVVARPQTYMNRSGVSVGGLLRACNVTPSMCLVVVDDIHLPVGRARIRRDGADGGHNGLRSVSEAIGNGFPRIRLGVGPAPAGVSLIDFVLGPFTVEQERVLEGVLARAVEAVLCIAREGVDAAMNRFNG